MLVLNKILNNKTLSKEYFYSFRQRYISLISKQTKAVREFKNTGAFNGNIEPYKRSRSQFYHIDIIGNNIDFKGKQYDTNNFTKI